MICKPHLLILVSVISFYSNAFVARWIADPKVFCGKDEEFIELSEIHCENNVIPLPDVRIDLKKISKSLDENYNNELNDLLGAKTLSTKIYNQAQESIRNYQEIKKNKTANAKIYRKKINRSLNRLISIEYELNELSTNLKRGERVSFVEKEKKEKKKASLELEKGLLLSESPILSKKSFQDFVERTSNKRFRKNYQRIRVRGVDVKREIISLKADNYFSLGEDQYAKVMEKSLDEMIGSSKTLLDRHRKALGKIGEVDEKNISLIRDQIMHEKSLVTDYFVAADPSNPNSDFNDFGGAACRLAGEFSAEELDKLMGSLGIDLALTAIPLGGPFLVGRSLAKISKLKKIPKKIKRIAQADSASLFSTMSTELSVMGVDTSLILEDIKQCEELRDLKFSLKGVEKKLESAVLECDQLLNDMILSYGAGMLSGATLTAKLMKRAKEKRSLNSKLSTYDEIYLKSANEIYQDFKCHDNIHRLAKKFEENGVDLSDAKVLYIIPDAIEQGQKLPYRYGKGELASDMSSWKHHVVMVKDGKIYDLDYPRNEVLSVEEYMKNMFPDVIKSGDDKLGSIRVREFDAKEYIDNFQGGDDAIASFITTDIRTIEVETQSIGDFYNSHAGMKISVPSPRIPKAYNQFAKPLYRSSDGRNLIDEDGDLVLEGRVETLDGETLWLDDEGVVEKILQN